VEVDEQSGSIVAELEIRQQLRLVYGMELGDGFHFDNHGALDHEIKPVSDLDSHASIHDWQLDLRQDFEAAASKLIGKTSVVCALE
jgi:hypothetical protein